MGSTVSLASRLGLRPLACIVPRSPFSHWFWAVGNWGERIVLCTQELVLKVAYLRGLRCGLGSSIDKANYGVEKWGELFSTMVLVSNGDSHRILHLDGSNRRTNRESSIHLSSSP